MSSEMPSGMRSDVVLVGDDLRAVSAVCVGAVVVAAVVGRDVALQAELLFAGEAVLAFAAGIDEASDPDAIPDGVLGDVLPDLADDAGDLVAGHHREDRGTPFFARLMDVGVADAGVGDVDQHVVRADSRRSMVPRSKA